MKPTHRSTLTDCGGDLWTVVASPFCHRFIRVSKHCLLGPLVFGPLVRGSHTLALLCEENGSILQHTEGGDDLAKEEDEPRPSNLSVEGSRPQHSPLKPMTWPH